MASPSVTIQPDRKTRLSLWNAKLFYLFFYGAIGFYITFFNIYLQDKGLSGTQIGWLNSIPPLIALVGNPFWGAIADRFRIHRLTAGFMALFAGFITLGFLIADQYWFLLLLVILLYFHRDPILSFIDSSAMALVTETGSDYGRIRLWGSIGFITASFGLGKLLTNAPLELMFWLQAAFLGIGCTALALLMPIRKQIRPKILKGIGHLLRQRKSASFFASNILFGMGLIFLQFMGLHMLALEATNAQIGLLFAAKASLEVPMMFLGGSFFNRFSNRWLVILGYVGQGIILVGLALAQSPTVLIWIISLTGVPFAIYRVATVAYANEIAPEGMETTTLSISNAGIFGLGNSLGSILYGYIWDFADGHAIIWAAATATLLAVIVFWWGSGDSNQKMVISKGKP